MTFNIINISGEILTSIIIKDKCILLDLKNALIRDGYVRVNTWEFDLILGVDVLKHNYRLNSDSDISYLTITYLHYHKEDLIKDFEVEFINKGFVTDNEHFYNMQFDDIYSNYTVKIVKRIITESRYLKEELNDLYISRHYRRSDNFGLILNDDEVLSDIYLKYLNNTDFVTLDQKCDYSYINNVKTVDTGNSKLLRLIEKYPHIAFLEINEPIHEISVKLAITNNVYVSDLKRFLINNKIIKGRLNDFLLVQDDLEVEYDRVLDVDNINANTVFNVLLKRNILSEEEPVCISVNIHCRENRGAKNEDTVLITIDPSNTIKTLKSVIQETDNITQKILRIWFTSKKNKIYFKDDDIIHNILNKYYTGRLNILLEHDHDSVYSSGIPGEYDILLVYFFIISLFLYHYLSF